MIEPARRVLHVGLAAAEVDLAEEDVAQRGAALGAAEEKRLPAVGRLGRRKRLPPDAARVRQRGEAVGTERRLHADPGRRKAPHDGYRWRALQHHPVREDVGEVHA